MKTKHAVWMSLAVMPLVGVGPTALATIEDTPHPSDLRIRSVGRAFCPG
jgi:hypothetical protein